MQWRDMDTGCHCVTVTAWWIMGHGRGPWERGERWLKSQKQEPMLLLRVRYLGGCHSPSWMLSGGAACLVCSLFHLPWRDRWHSPFHSPSPSSIGCVAQEKRRSVTHRPVMPGRHPSCTLHSLTRQQQEAGGRDWAPQRSFSTAGGESVPCVFYGAATSRGGGWVLVSTPYLSLKGWSPDWTTFWVVEGSNHCVFACKLMSLMHVGMFSRLQRDIGDGNRVEELYTKSQSPEYVIYLLDSKRGKKQTKLYWVLST